MVATRILSSTEIDGRHVGCGDLVCIGFRQEPDLFDWAMAGAVATIEGIEQDGDDRVFLRLAVEGDASSIHRLCYAAEDVSLLDGAALRLDFERDNRPTPARHITAITVQCLPE